MSDADHVQSAIQRAADLAFIKSRALEYVELGQLLNAAASFIADAPKWNIDVRPEVVTILMFAANDNDAREVRRLIDGFS